MSTTLAVDRMNAQKFSHDGEVERERQPGYLFDAALLFAT